VVRCRSDADGRMVLVTLTSEGRAKIEHLFPRFNAEESAVAAALSPEQQDQAASMLRALLARVDRPPAAAD
jgi:MarR family transcriptional regulator, organic hydroperoxide resistance regulator